MDKSATMNKNAKKDIDLELAYQKNGFIANWLRVHPEFRTSTYETFITNLEGGHNSEKPNDPWEELEEWLRGEKKRKN